MTDEQKKTSAKPIGSISEYATLGRKHTEVQTSTSPDIETSLKLDGRKSKHPEWVQRTYYIPPDLAKWARLQALQSDIEVSEIVTQALREYREKHS